MLQEKAQDRERLLLKFIKIMKVTDSVPSALPPYPRRPEPSPAPPYQPCATHPFPHHRLSLQHLRKLNNFNSYLAILSALDSAPIRRLEWQRQTSEVGGGKSGQAAMDLSKTRQGSPPGRSPLCDQGFASPHLDSSVCSVQSAGPRAFVVGCGVVPGPGPVPGSQLHLQSLFFSPFIQGGCSGLSTALGLLGIGGRASERLRSASLRTRAHTTHRALHEA